MQNPGTCDCDCNKGCKIGEYVDIKNCSLEKCLFFKLVLACEDDILNTTKTSLDDKIVTRGKYYCLIHTISLVVIWLL